MPWSSSSAPLPDVFSYRANDLVTLRQGFAQPPREAGPWVYWFWWNNVVSREEIALELEEMATASKEGRQKRGDGPTECQLAVSRDGLNWRRLPRPAYIGIGRHDGKNLKQIYSTCNLVRRGYELWHYFLGTENDHGSSSVPNARWDLYRVTQRLDGFVAAQPPISGGRLVTKPRTFTGNRLRLNIDTDTVGFAQVGFLDERGHPVKGRTP